MKFTYDDLIIINSQYPTLNFKPIYNPSRDQGLYYADNLFKNIPSEKYNLHKTSFAGYYELTNTDITAFDMELTGRLPLTDEEIVISKYNFDMFKEYNFKSQNDVEFQINTYNDLIGKEIRIDYYTKFTVVGIVDTKFDIQRYEPLTERSDNYLMMMLLMDEYETVRKFSVHNLVFVRNGYIERNKATNGFDVDASYRLGFGLSLKYNDNNEYFEYINKVSKADMDDVIISGRMMHEIKNSIINNDYQMYYDFVKDYIMTYLKSLPSNKIEEFMQVYDPDFSDFDLLNQNDKEIVYETIYNNHYYSETAHSGNIGRNSEELYEEGKEAFFDEYGIYEMDMVKTIYDYVQEEEFQQLVIAGYIDEDVEDYSIPRKIIVSDEYYDDFGFLEPGDYSGLISAINPTDKATIKKLVKGHYKNEGIVYQYKNPVTSILSSVNSFVETLADIFLYIGIAFAIFSSLLLLNYISTSVSYKKKEIGILRAIGARGKDVLGIFTKESTIIALINFTLALAGVIAATIIINNKIRNDYNILITLLKPGVRQIALMLGVTLLVGFISSALPVIRIARKRPIDAIRDN